MSVIVKSGVPGKVPTQKQLVYGQIAINYADEVMYFKNASNQIIPVDIGTSGGTVTNVSGTGTVSGITLTGSVSTSGSLTLGGTLSIAPADFGSQTQKTFLAAPNAANGMPTFRTILASDIPVLNQNTTGNAGTVTNGVYTTSSYADPAWITSINYSKLTGTIPTWNQNTTGSAATLTTGRTIGMTGDVTWTSASFNGSGNVTGTATLANSGVTAGTYTKVTVDVKGRVTSGASLVSADLPIYTGTITSSQITTGLGFTPYNSTNPSGYITSSGSITGNAATATKLATSRTINGVSFDGTANITINAVDSTARIPTSEKGVANGVATLDSNGLVPTNQIPVNFDSIIYAIALG